MNPPLPADDDAEAPHAGDALAGCLTPMLARIPDTYRAALELTDLGDLTQEEGAALLGLSTSGMKSRVQRGRRLLRQEVVRCCRVELDARGAISDAAPRGDADSC
jgi:RNA polymerase sigma-70 factor (ECF subfamily)